MTALLDSVRILAVEQYGAGPYGSMLLAELGAEVIKIEAPSMGGDVSRGVGPYLLGEGDSQFYQTFSRSKKSVTLEIKTSEGRSQFEGLVKTADAVINNLRGDQPAKLKITYDDLKTLNSKIVCAHLSAYGRDNDRSTWPGYDYLMQAEAGFMSVTGEPDAPPTRFGLSMVDFMTGAQMAVGCAAAIIKARASGEGCDVDVSLFDVALHQLSYPGVWAMNGGHIVGRLPRGAHPSIAPSQVVKTKDGWGFITCQTPKFWDKLCDLTGGEALKGDPRFATIKERRVNLDARTIQVDKLFQQKTSDEWVSVLGGKVPFAPIYDLKQALENPYIQDIGMRDTVDHPEADDGKLHMLASPIKVNGKRMPAQRAPKMGEHTDELLGE